MDYSSLLFRIVFDKNYEVVRARGHESGGGTKVTKGEHAGGEECFLRCLEATARELLTV